MNNIAKALVLLLSLSCTNPKQENDSLPLTQETLAVTTEDTVIDPLTKQDTATLIASTTPAAEEIPEDCVFDQLTQTDEFLKNVNELQGYKWDQEKQTATFLLETGDTLLIYRGGCSHFVVEAQFRLRKDKTDYSKWSNVYKKTLWIAKVLHTEFDHKELQQDIENDKVTFEKYEEVGMDMAQFTSERLLDRNYKIERKLEPGLQILTLSYSIN